MTSRIVAAGALRRGQRQRARWRQRRGQRDASIIGSRHAPLFKAMRQRLEAGGNPFKVAIIATTRKLLAILNAMIRDNLDYA